LAVAAIELIIEGLKYAPEVEEAAKGTWRNLWQARVPNGIVGTTFYSAQHKFKISVPDLHDWIFWKPTPEYLATIDSTCLWPTYDLPVMILYKGLIKLYRPTIYVAVQEVGQTPIEDFVESEKAALQYSHYKFDDKSIKIASNYFSGGLLGTSDSDSTCVLEQIFFHACKGYFIRAFYVSDSADMVRPPQGLREVMNSFKLIK
jgi:hypothetical protein